ncbi:Hypothetical predicted protein [Mytilus galloprovincialis]|uniref:Myb-like domain-containing protein n=1 Tax=Mytilus galloprovincialis TaxID=29158 RepID=A0A8B6HGN2_MYTGA|nr:Hypothetical predicted protein [Mytilus galloprovincialis]
MDAEKKKRRSNWDSSEISLLRQLVEKNLFTIRSKFSNSLTNKSKVEVWRGITVQINALGLHGRTVAEVKVKWQNMQSNAKKTYQDVKKHTHQTGGGPPATPINQESQKIIEMMKDTSSFVGLTGEESPVDEVVYDTAEKLPINTDGEEIDEDQASLPPTPVQPIISISMLDKDKDPLLPVNPHKRPLKSFPCPIIEKKIKPEDVVVKQHEVLCKQSEYYDLKNQKLKIEIAILKSQMDKHELASSVCDLFGLEL